MPNPDSPLNIEFRNGRIWVRLYRAEVSVTPVQWAAIKAQVARVDQEMKDG